MRLIAILIAVMVSSVGYARVAEADELRANSPSQLHIKSSYRVLDSTSIRCASYGGLIFPLGRREFIVDEPDGGGHIWCDFAFYYAPKATSYAYRVHKFPHNHPGMPNRLVVVPFFEDGSVDPALGEHILSLDQLNPSTSSTLWLW
ncbi:MAG: hypothetical protein JAZ11_13840 [Candidatus Thiodiazotropha lotti]|nr:hypothetical protein [Candidatus Thiodiazotropha lotti]